MELQKPLNRITHFAMCGGSGWGPRGIQEAHARVGTLNAEMECLGGMDVDPVACVDFERLLGVKQTCADLFDLEQFRGFHAPCVSSRKRCSGCNNTGQPPAGWREQTGEDVRRAAQNRVPDIVFVSAPCKGLSSLLSPKASASMRYQALNRLTVRCVRLMLDAWGDDPPPLFLFENVPLIATRGRALVDEIKDMLFLHGYAVTESFHDCGEIGGLAQRRRRFLLVARHRVKVPPLLHEPPKFRLRGVGEVIGGLPMPDAPEAGPMHRCPRLTWETWVRLALIPAGGDWRSLEGMDFTKLGIQPLSADYGYRGALGVTGWSEPAGAVSAQGRPATGAFNVADARVQAAVYHDGAYGVQGWEDPSSAVTTGGGPSTGVKAVGDPRYFDGAYGVQRWDEPAHAVTGKTLPANGVNAVGDPRQAGVKEGKKRNNDVFRVVRWDGPAGAVTGGAGPSSGGQAVADPRDGDHGRYQTYRVLDFNEPAPAITASSEPGGGGYTVADPRLRGGWGTSTSKYPVTPWAEPTRTVIGANGTGDGAAAVADPRWGGGAFGVQGWEEPAHAVTGESYPSNGVNAIADPRLGSYGQHANKLRVEGWGEPVHTVTGSDRVGSGAPSVADPRVPEFHNLCRVESWDEPAHTVTGGTRPAGGALSVADPRVQSKARRDDFVTSGHYGVVSWSAPSGAVTANGQHDNGAFSVADPRPLPAALDRPDPVCIIIALDGTWHRPFTTLDLAAIQYGEDIARELMERPMAGTSHTVWREHIGNGVPRATARAIGSVAAKTLLMARTNQTFCLSATPVWVRPVAVALGVDARPVSEIVGPVR